MCLTRKTTVIKRERCDKFGQVKGRHYKKNVSEFCEPFFSPVECSLMRTITYAIKFSNFGLFYSQFWCMVFFKMLAKYLEYLD